MRFYLIFKKNNYLLGESSFNNFYCEPSFLILEKLINSKNLNFKIRDEQGKNYEIQAWLELLKTLTVKRNF